MHEHKDCEHEFKYCRICDTVYCEKCGKEWKVEVKLKMWYNSPSDGMTISYDHTHTG